MVNLAKMSSKRQKLPREGAGRGLVRVLRALSLFSGIGGLDLAAEMAGIMPVAFCEIEEYPVKILNKEVSNDWSEKGENRSGGAYQHRHQQRKDL